LEGFSHFCDWETDAFQGKELFTLPGGDYQADK
jgi:hypothetical protein